MPAQNTPRRSANLNHLRRGVTYRATTRSGIAEGEFLGMEAVYGERAVMLRHTAGTESISRYDIVTIESVAA